MRLRQRPVVWNMAVLAVSGLIERILGAVYRVSLARAAGPAALGLIQMCLPILRLGVIIGTLGLPQVLAGRVAAMLAGNRPAEARQAFAWSFRISAVSSLIIGAVLIFVPPSAQRLFPDPRVSRLLPWLAPILLCDCLSLILAANLQGRSRMCPVALAGIIGQGTKLGMSLILVRRAAAGGAGTTAAAAFASILVCDAVAFLILLILSKWERSPGRSTPLLPRELIRSSLPLMGDALVFAVAAAVDMVIIPHRLIQGGMAKAVVVPLMGRVWGMALPTLFLPMVLVWPIAAATLPVIAAADARGNLPLLRQRIKWTYASVAAISVCTMLVMQSAAVPITTRLFSCPSAAVYLRSLAWIACPVYLASISGSLMVGLGRTAALFRQALVCAALRTFLVYVLTGLPGLGVNGAIVGIGVCNGLLAMANARTIARHIRQGCPVGRSSCPSMASTEAGLV